MPKLTLSSFTPLLRGKLSSILASSAQTTAPTSLSMVVQRAYANRMSPGMAAAALTSAVNRFPLRHWIVPERYVSEQIITRRMDLPAGLNNLREETHDALLYLANRKDSELKRTIQRELGVALSDGHTAEAHWVPRMMTAHAADDRDTVALAATILGEHHPAVAHLRDPTERPAVSAPAIMDPLAGEGSALPVSQAVKHAQNLATLRSLCAAHYQLDKLESTRAVTDATLSDRLAGTFAPLSLALRDLTVANHYVPCLKDPAVRDAAQQMFSRMQDAIPAAIAYWQSVLSRRGLEQSPGLAEMACSWLGEDDLAVIAFRASTGRVPAPTHLPAGTVEWSTLVSSASSSSGPLLTAQQTCESVISETETTWEETEPLITGTDAEVFDPPPAYSVFVQAEPEPPSYYTPHDPSITRLAAERMLRRAPMLAFIADMKGDTSSSEATS